MHWSIFKYVNLLESTSMYYRLIYFYLLTNKWSIGIKELNKWQKNLILKIKNLIIQFNNVKKYAHNYPSYQANYLIMKKISFKKALEFNAPKIEIELNSGNHSCQITYFLAFDSI